ncbi:hypothetical protein MTO96_029489 [Rhipicephalus appendiculatus]
MSNRCKSFAGARKERQEKERKERKQHHRPMCDEPEATQLASPKPNEDASPGQRPEADEAKHISRKMSRLDDYKSFSMSGGAARQGKMTEEMRRKQRMQLTFFLSGVFLMATFLVSVVVYVTVFYRQTGDPRQPRYVSPTPMASFREWIVASGDVLCQSEAKRMIDMNGTVGDAAVATMLCQCVVRPYRCGLGGGFFATYYNKKNREARAVVARETAPSSAFSDMYHENVNHSYRGFTAVAVFGELRGYEALLNLTGTRVPWKELFAKAIQYADNGFEVSEEFSRVIQEHAQAISDEYTTTLKKILTNSATKTFYTKGNTFYNKVLAQTLRNISENPLKGSSLYTGPLAEALVNDISKEVAKHITLYDLEHYEPWVTRALSLQLSMEETVFVPPPPSGGVMTAFALSVLDKFRTSEGLLPDDALSAHRMVEALKFAYGNRPKLGDMRKVKLSSLISSLTSPEMATELASRKILDRALPNVQDYGIDSASPDDRGSNHIVIVGPDGDAIAMTSTINDPFGALVASESTGIILNNEMRDFSRRGTVDVYGYPARTENDIEPGKRPMSSLTPLIVVDRSGDVLFVASALGGPKCTSALTQVAMRTLWMKHTVKQAIDAGRLHNHLLPENVVRYEKIADKDVLWFLKKHGHEVAPSGWQGEVIAVHRVQSESEYRGSYDFRMTDSGALDGA